MMGSRLDLPWSVCSKQGLELELSVGAILSPSLCIFGETRADLTAVVMLGIEAGVSFRGGVRKIKKAILCDEDARWTGGVASDEKSFRTCDEGGEVRDKREKGGQRCAFSSISLRFRC